MPLTNVRFDAPYGWRARFGLLQPSLVSDTNPIEFYLMAPSGVQLVLTSLGIGDDGPRAEAYERAIAGIETPIRRLLARKVDVIVQAGVPPVVQKGWGFEEELRARVARWTNVPFASDVGCSIAAMQALGIRRVAMLVADDMQRSFAEYIAHAGIDVAAARSIRIPEGQEAGTLSLKVPYQAAVDLVQSTSGVDGVWIPIAARPSVGMIEALEEAIGLPVVTSAQAMMWQGLRLLGVRPSEVTGFGRLFHADDAEVHARVEASRSTTAG
jgi:maleate isomerase